MSYNELLPWRALAQRIPKDVLNPTHRLIIVTLITYESADKGAYFTPANISAELGLSYRSVMDNFHYLGSGLVWKDRIRQACINSQCKDHLEVLKTSHYARANRAQTYRLDMVKLEELASMHSSAHSPKSMHLDTEEHAPEHLKHAPEGSSASTTPHAYKHNKHFIDMDKRTYEDKYKLFNTLRPLLRDELRHLQGGKNYESALDILESKGATVEEVARHINSQNFAKADNLGGLVASMLTSYADSYTSVKPIVKPAWCGLCESPENRVEKFSYEIESYPPGARSRVCRACGTAKKSP